MALFRKKEKEDKKETGTGLPAGGQEKEASKEVAPVTKLPKGNDAGSYQIILGPHITEKASMLGEQNKYVFRIAPGAGKTEVGKAIEKLYGVHVTKVQVLTMPSKFRQVGRYEGRKSGFRKATVTLKEGDRIEITG